MATHGAAGLWPGDVLGLLFLGREAGKESANMEWFENEDGTLKCFGHAYEYNRQALHCGQLIGAGRCNEQRREKCWNRSNPYEGLPEIPDLEPIRTETIH